MRLLVVEDDPDIGALLEVWFIGYATVTLRTSALAVTEEDLVANEAILADERMPDVTGCQLLTWAARVSPRMRRVLWTASGVPVSCPAAHAVVTKPTSLAELMGVLGG